MGLIKRSPPTPAATDRRRRERGPDGLRQQLRAAESESRRLAALDLASLDLDAHPEVVSDLLAALSVETVPAVRDALLTTLSAHDTPEVARALAALLGSDDPGTRNGVVVALQTMPRGLAGVVDELLVSPQVRVRTLSVVVLSVLAHPGVGAWLQRIVQLDEDANVVAAAVDAAQLLDPVLAATVARTAAVRFPGNPYLGFLATVAARKR